MFNLEAAITDWRHKMLAAGIETPVPLEELEIHLREDIEQQVQAGVNLPAAFVISVRSLGPAGALTNEFLHADVATKARWRRWFALRRPTFVMTPVAGQNIVMKWLAPPLQIMGGLFVGLAGGVILVHALFILAPENFSGGFSFSNPDGTFSLDRLTLFISGPLIILVVGVGALGTGVVLLRCAWEVFQGLHIPPQMTHLTPPVPP